MQQISSNGHLGNIGLLRVYKVAFFCSRQCPGKITSKRKSWLTTLVKGSSKVISGFHTPVEKEVLRGLLKGRSPIIKCLARGLYRRIPKEQKKAFDENRILYLSFFYDKCRRITADLSEKRNMHIVDLSDEVIVAYASPGE